MRITQYDRKSLSPQAVGVPGESRAGEIIGRGVSALGAALTQREEASDKLSASQRFGDFQFEYGAKKIAMQQEYADRPLEYPAAVKKVAEDMTTEFGKSLNGRSFQHFKQLTGSAIAQDSEALATWSYRRDNEIQVGKITDIKQNIALRAATVTGADGLRTILSDFSKASVEATQMIDADSDAKLTEKYVDLAKKNAMFSQIYARPMQVYRDLEGGVYKGLLTPEEISDFTAKARNAIYNRAEDDNYRTMYMAQGKLLDFQKGLDDGSVTITDLIVEREAAWANKDQKDVNGKPVVPVDYVSGLDNLINTVMYSKMRLPMNKDAAKIVLDKFDTDWDTYLLAKKDRNEQPNEKDIAKELSLYANLLSLYQSGTIMKSDFDEKSTIMRTKLALKKGQVPRVKSFDDVIEQAGTVPNLWWRKPGNDVVSLGYSMIKDFVDRGYSDPDVRRTLKAQMLAQYHQVIENTPEEEWKNLKTENERMAYARKRVLGVTGPKGEQIPGVAQQNMKYIDPVSKRQIAVGESVSQNGATKILSGFDSNTGRPIWGLAPGTEGKQVNIWGRVYKVTGIREDGEFLLKEVKDGRK